MRFQTFADVTDHLDRLGLFHADYSLRRMRAALASLGLGRRAIPAQSVVQIVGTNGKGSTATFLAAMAEAHGLKVGLYTSPHLVRVTERVRLNREPLAEARWPELAQMAWDACPELTYFELLTVIALLAFCREQADLIILEAGLGGTLDATTAVDADLVCFSPIAMDHAAVLGPDLLSIARDKVGAIRPGKPVITARQQAGVMACLSAASVERGSELFTAMDQPLIDNELPALGLRGAHQETNAALALAAWRYVAWQNGWRTRHEAERQGLGRAFIPGRLQGLELPHGRLILDGAHNPHGLCALIAALRQTNTRPGAVLFTCMEDKDRAAMLALVRRLAGGAPVFVPGLPDNERAADPVRLAAELGGTACVDVAEALDRALAAVGCRAEPDGRSRQVQAGGRGVAPQGQPAGPVLACGSLYLLGEIFGLYPQGLSGA